MKTNKLIAVIVGVTFTLSSCTYFLVEKMDGGHSPMMQMDGDWQIASSTETTNGATKEAKQADAVFLNATKDLGGRCQGTWVDPQPNVKADFNWGIDEKATTFIIVDETKGDVNWKVLEQSKDVLKIEREENGTKYYMELKR